MSPENQQKLALGKYCLHVIYFLIIHCLILPNDNHKLTLWKLNDTKDMDILAGNN